MSERIHLLDCTLRDGGYINDWKFGENAIVQIIRKLTQTGIEMIEIGFLKGDNYDPDRSLFPDIDSIENVLNPKYKKVMFVGMLDMNTPIPLKRITKNSGRSIDGIRVIFKHNKMNDAYVYCQHIKEMGYKLFVNFVNTDCYTDKEFIEGIERFNCLDPAGITIVDTFGMIKRKHFMRLAAIADNNMNKDTMLCYHAHNNLQQAFGNAEALVEMNLSRDICIDACIFGMGRGAGNLNLELFAEYMNENYGCSYRIAPMLEIMDEYLNEFYRTKYWGYSLPLYLSATQRCHPNYAIYLAEKNTLSEKAFSELLRGISDEDKMIFNTEKAEEYYKKFMDNYVDDEDALLSLTEKFHNKKVILLAPGKSIKEYKDNIIDTVDDNTLVVCVNFYNKEYFPNFVFIGNTRRFMKIVVETDCEVICTSNVFEHYNADYVINFSSFTGNNNAVFDNSGLMSLRFMDAVGVKEVFIAGMDGYSESEIGDYYHDGFGASPLNKMFKKNDMIANELQEIKKHLNIRFITPSLYEV